MSVVGSLAHHTLHQLLIDPFFLSQRERRRDDEEEDEEVGGREEWRGRDER